MTSDLTKHAGIKHGKKVHNGSGQYEKMPDGMRILATFPNIEENSQRIEQTAQNQKSQADVRQPRRQLLGRKHHQPPHQQIEAN